MATILNNAAYMALPMNIKRGNPLFLSIRLPYGMIKRNQKLMLRVAPPPMLAKF